MIKRNTPPGGITRRYIAAFVKVFVLAAFLVAAVQGSASAAKWRNMEVYNNTGRTIYRLYISPRGNPSWGTDLLGRSQLPNGGHTTIRYDANAQYYEIWVVFANGSEHKLTGEKALNFYGSTMLVISLNGNGLLRAQVD